MTGFPMSTERMTIGIPLLFAVPPNSNPPAQRSAGGMREVFSFLTTEKPLIKELSDSDKAEFLQKLTTKTGNFESGVVPAGFTTSSVRPE